MVEMGPVFSQFMDGLKKGGGPVVIFLINGVKLQGVVENFDAGSLILRRDQNVQLLLLDAISTIVPQTQPAA